MPETEAIFSIPVTFGDDSHLNWVDNIVDIDDIDYVRYVVTDFHFIQAWCVVILVILTNGPLIYLILSQVMITSISYLVNMVSILLSFTLNFNNIFARSTSTAKCLGLRKLPMLDC